MAARDVSTQRFQTQVFKPSRRRLLRVMAGASLGASLMSTTQARAALPENLFVPMPIPPQAPARGGVAILPGTKLFYWDTGGDGPAVTLMHPATGSALIWGYQQPAFVKAGYRVIGYSRRGYFGSEPADKTNGGVPSEDLIHLLDFLGVKKSALVASAAGVTITLDCAMSHPDRLSAIVVSGGSLGNLEEPEYLKASDALALKGFDDLPADFRELGPSYRAANPEGARAWAELEHRALNGNRLGPRNANKFTWATLGAIRVPTLFMAGAADLLAPPSLMRIAAAHVPGAEMIVVPETGHSAYWESPELFNRAVIEFLARAARW